MKKKAISVVLGMAMLATAISGCSGSTATTTAAATTKAAAVTTAAAATTKAGETTAAAGGNKKIILITMDSTDQHWVNVDKGCQEEAAALGNITYKWMAPDKKDDAQQIERINNAIADGADAILIAANGPDAITGALEEAKAAGIVIVYVDSPANTPAVATFSTDNKAAGKTAGEQMLAALATAKVTKGSIGIVNINTATDSTNKREAGFREAFDGSAFTILETQYGEGDAAKSQDIADNYITDGVVGIFGCNEGATVGVGNAIKGAGGGIVGVGFDRSDAILSLIKDGSLVCTMVQNPSVMGSEGLKAAAAVLAGETLTETAVDTGVSIVDASNVDSIK